MNNINIYNERMAKAMEDKLWFLQFLNMPTFNKNAVVYDFGCADGELIRHLAPMFPNIQFIGIDNSYDMLNLARQRQTYNNERYLHNSELFLNRFNFDTSIMIMSSVYHEIVNYLETEDFAKIMDWIKPEYIFFRDMIPNESINRYSSQKDMNKIIKKTWEDKSRNYTFINQLVSFSTIYGNLTNQRNLLHFLLKYRYVENWNREVQENYLPCTYDELIKKFSKHYIPIYSKQYTLPYIREIVKKDFDIDLMDNTHANIIFKRNF